MTDKVQKIREEVERLRNLHQMKYQQLNINDNMCLVECGKRNLCNELLSFIDSLQEEPVSIWHDASEKPERDDLLIETNDGRIIHRQSINNYGMVKRWAYTSALLNLDNSCNLGNNSQEEPVSDDLKKAHWNAAIKYDSKIPFGEYLFRAGVNWKREQMMKGATEAIVKVDAGGYPYIPQIELYDYDKDVPLAKEDDKYKVILIKED